MADIERKNTTPLISLITVNYNQAVVTCDLLESTRQLTYPNFEIIVVDNGSVEDPTERIKAGNYPHVRIIVSPENLGFSGGNNLGIQQAKGDYFFLLNNDTIVTPDLLEQLIKPFFQESTIGVCCPKIRYYDEPDVIQYAGYYPLNKYTGRTWAIGLMEPDQGQYDRAEPTHFAHGAAMLVSREVLDRVGSLDDSFFLYYEELDWSMRIRKAGYQIYYQPEALIYHRESMSVGKQNPMKVYYHTRNRLWFMRRNVETLPLLVFYTYYFGLALPKALLQYTLRWQPDYLKAVSDAVIWNLKHKVTETHSEGKPSPVAKPFDAMLTN
ncbi:glycosyltransferase family 2 protein [Spirosoma radiotolerans]|uniref:Glycosyl transferase family 2 n=1 Tax=Spirosoma radiotolerans TaxID=1379870 RepID=A0A0E3ZV75_9BACT|nr:glycosyltransferase family 2 protein [Spirosoma radiotolerans]AKD55973.1 glycosyl transferase family 2 [Spirosoma radiotolerans]